MLVRTYLQYKSDSTTTVMGLDFFFETSSSFLPFIQEAVDSTLIPLPTMRIAHSQVDIAISPPIVATENAIKVESCSLVY